MSLCVLILKVHLHHLHHLHHTSTSHGARLVYQSKVAQKLWAFIRTPPPVASYGLHHRYLGLIVSVSNLYLSWPPMVSTLAFSETPSLYQNSTSHGLLWSLPMRNQFFVCILWFSPPFSVFLLISSVKWAKRSFTFTNSFSNNEKPQIQTFSPFNYGLALSSVSCY